MNIGFPELVDSFLSGQDILYKQFNKIEFYIEDKDQEHLYFNILKTLFPKIKFEKIFPLNGKTNVINEAGLNLGNKAKIFIVDLDFDKILRRVVRLDNLFYLKCYSIENHLLSKKGVFEIIRNKNPKLKDPDIEGSLNYEKLIQFVSKGLKELSCAFIIIQKHNLGIEYHGMNISRDFNFAGQNIDYRMNFIPGYLLSVELSLKNKNARFTLKGQSKAYKKYFKPTPKSMENIPGKYILTFIKERLQTLSLVSQVSLESFTYMLSKEINSKELNYLKKNIQKYLA